jgi:hypothetical protein
VIGWKAETFRGAGGSFCTVETDAAGGGGVVTADFGGIFNCVRVSIHIYMYINQNITKFMTRKAASSGEYDRNAQPRTLITVEDCLEALAVACEVCEVAAAAAEGLMRRAAAAVGGGGAFSGAVETAAEAAADGALLK